MQENLRFEPKLMCNIEAGDMHVQFLSSACLWSVGHVVELPARCDCCVLLLSISLMGMQVRIAVVGQGTGQVIEAHQEPLLHIGYTPPKVKLVCWSSLL